MNIENISLVRLLNSEHLSLSQKIAVILKTHLDALPELKILSDRLDSLITVEFKTFEVLDSSVFTAQKAEADRMRDNAARQLLHYVRSFEFSDEIAKVAAAYLLYDLLKEVTGIIVSANERETVLLINLVTRLREEPYTHAVELLGAADLVQKVADKNAAFNTISSQQTVTDSAKDSGNMNAIRKPVDRVLRQLFKAIESSFDLEIVDDRMKILVHELNYDIKEAQTKMRQRLGRNKNDDDDETKG